MRTLVLAGVRSEAQTHSLVAILIEEGGPGLLAVPVGARAGLALQVPPGAGASGWALALSRTAQALGGGVSHAHLRLDPDARILSSLVLNGHGGGAVPTEVPLTPAQALVLAHSLRVPLLAEDRVLALHGVDLDGAIDPALELDGGLAPAARPEIASALRGGHGPVGEMEGLDVLEALEGRVDRWRRSVT